MGNAVIKVENISKQYRLGEIGTGSLAHDLNQWWHKVRGKENPYLKVGEANDRAKSGTSEYVWSLKDLNFEVNQGDAVGVIGRNGAGKSTLLKILSRVTAPTTGSVKVKGRIASLLEVGTGFHPDLSGRENIYLNGAILGMRKSEITRKFDEIVDFAGVERYIDTPVKRYSSGMYVRLAFGVAAHLESEILIVDEVLAVGDAEFQKKCLGKMNDVSRGEGRTVLFVSHNMMSIQTLCKKGIMLHNGGMEYDGDIQHAIEYYFKDQNYNSTLPFSKRKRFGNGSILFTDVRVYDSKGKDTITIEAGDDLTVVMNYEVIDKSFNYTGIVASLNITDHHGVRLYNHTNLLENKVINMGDLKSSGQFTVTIKNLPLVQGNYIGGINLFHGGTVIDFYEHAFDLEVILGESLNYKASPDPKQGPVLIETFWNF